MSKRRSQPRDAHFLAGLKIGRKYSTDRIRAYECELDSSGKPVRKIRSLRVGWYGLLDEAMLRTRILGKLAEYARQGWHYPFLLIQVRLVDKTDVRLRRNPPRRGSDIGFAPRKADPRFGETPVAVVVSETEYRLLQ